MQISKNFKLDEFTASTTAKQNKIDNSPTKEVENNIILLVNNVLQPLRDYMGISCKINSGYRCPALNKKIGGAANSAHMNGGACDFTFGSKTLNKKAFEWIKQNCKYRQLIDEKDLSWVHVEYREDDNKKQVLKIK